jgi:Fur family ferric uptake transcriptional regulator
VDAAVAALRERGLRVSAARRLVLESLFAADAPVSAERIAAGVAGRVPRSDLASVYRNLETLEELGLVRHVHLGHGPGLYALVTDEEREYLVCESCDAVRVVATSELDGVRDGIRNTFGFDARFGHFPIVGLCPDCRVEADEHESH